MANNSNNLTEGALPAPIKAMRWGKYGVEKSPLFTYPECDFAAFHNGMEGVLAYVADNEGERIENPPSYHMHSPTHEFYLSHDKRLLIHASREHGLEFVGKARGERVLLNGLCGEKFDIDKSEKIINDFARNAKVDWTKAGAFDFASLAFLRDAIIKAGENVRPGFARTMPYTAAAPTMCYGGKPFSVIVTQGENVRSFAPAMMQALFYTAWKLRPVLGMPRVCEAVLDDKGMLAVRACCPNGWEVILCLMGLADGAYKTRYIIPIRG